MKNVFVPIPDSISFTKGQHQSRGKRPRLRRLARQCQPDDDGEALQVLERAAAEYTRGERRGQIESRFHLGFSCPQMG